MRKHWKRWLTMFVVGWLAGGATITAVISQYNVEDFSLPDLVPMFLVLAVGGALGTTILMALLLWLERITEQKSVVRRSWRVSILFWPLLSALVCALVTGIVTGWRALVSESLPMGEAVSFTSAFALMGLAAGFAFTGFGSQKRRWLAISVRAALTIIAVALVSFAVPRIEEALLARAANGEVVRAVTMSVPRSAHTATLLPDGRVLLAGGMVEVRGAETSTDSIETYEPRTGEIKVTGRLCLPRAGHTATLLRDGNVLFTGGGNDQSNLRSAELYRVATGDCIRLNPMRVPRERHAASLLTDGRVLITGGTIAQPSDETDIFDPGTGAFLAGPRLHARRAAHSATVLKDGRVVIAGGAASLQSVLRSVEIYDPVSNEFKEAGPLSASRYKHSAVLLENDRVLLLGGSDERDWNGRRNTVELYDARTGRSRFVSPLHRARFKFPSAVAVTANGKVVVGGAGRRVEVFDVAREQFSVSSGSVEDEWFYATATALPDGRVFIAGGYNSSLYPTNQAWVYRPATRTMGTSSPLMEGR